MNSLAPETVRMKAWVENWRVVSEEMEREKAVALRALTQKQSAEIFNGMDCDPATVWTSEERKLSSGLVEQQRLFAFVLKNESCLRRGA
jgi:hypothetical protein